jgi:maltose alpha-D-glucosyltransferase/alpha-amylase
MVLKLFRRLQPGVHPEIEIGRYLTDVAHFHNAPALLGAAIHESADNDPTAMAVLTAYVQNQGDGWALTLDYLKRFFDETDLLPAEAMEEAADRHGLYLTRMSTLGRLTAELHRAFALPTEDPAFSPEDITSDDLATWVESVQKQADDAIAALQRITTSMSDEDREQAYRLVENRERLRDVIASVVPKATKAMKTRCHGDLHLGQVLVAQNDFYFVDFEGEPSRSLDERRAKQMPLRDVAGMLRSVDYAAASAQKLASIRPESRVLIASWAEDWRLRAKDAYMHGYQAAIGDCPSYPSSPAAVQGFLQLFLLEKAVYEINYEAANRPSWVRIPIDGVLELIGQPS